MDGTKQASRGTDPSQSEARYRALLVASPDANFHMSANWSEMRHLDDQGFLIDTVESSAGWQGKYLHPDDQAAVADAIALAIRDHRLFDFEHRDIRADGTFGRTAVLYRSSAVTIRFLSGSVPPATLPIGNATKPIWPSLATSAEILLASTTCAKSSSHVARRLASIWV